MGDALLASIDALGWGVLIFVGLLFGIPYTRLFLRKRAIPGWPTTSARITEAVVARGSPGLGYGYFLLFHCSATYAFEVGNQTYTGWFGMAAGNAEIATDLAKKVQGMTITIRYNPNNPKYSVPLEKRILGRSVTDDDQWLNPRVW